MKNILIFDFGHGTREYTTGKHSPDKTLFEGEWNREVGRMIIDAIDFPDVECKVLVPENLDISLTERCKRANKIVASNPDAQCTLISIHLNAAGNGEKWYNASGFAVYVCPGASNKSKELAKLFESSAQMFGLSGNRSVPAEGFWTANFAILRGTNCPAVLTENLFQDNQAECAFLKSKVGKEKIVSLHRAALKQYLGLS